MGGRSNSVSWLGWLWRPEGGGGGGVSEGGGRGGGRGEGGGGAAKLGHGVMNNCEITVTLTQEFNLVNDKFKRHF